MKPTIMQDRATGRWVLTYYGYWTNWALKYGEHKKYRSDQAGCVQELRHLYRQRMIVRTDV